MTIAVRPVVPASPMDETRRAVEERRRWQRTYIIDLVLFDIVATSIAATMALLGRFGFDRHAVIVWNGAVPYGLLSVVLVIVWIILMALSRSYDVEVVGAGADEYQRVINGAVRFVALF